MKILPLKITDYDRVYALWQTEHMGLNNVADTRDGIEKFLRRNPNTSFVAELDGDIVGAILCGNDGRSGYIYHACVSREHQNKKIGTRLVAKVFEALKAEEISDVTLAVYSDNEDGKRFWERMGFRARDFLTYRNKALVELEWYD
ncbi:MAG TPA: GNAT family N-acetyltransferase [Methylomusa anaerophila]|uniref:Acetyltransferase YpeA n=1 Tax=Methylomusa anaerophila TaxID=1930071 RepID=A0A348AGM6_9FIRM|nr:GNAT family N-acetyltransferase [Methylomusa anaerophila]BBB90224.1 acetyltransferase YpeA [Methylomusa anaerophila]HML90740.1 GNAT family N-acetyltransferase [Methylomusa anaerophila]